MWIDIDDEISQPMIYTIKDKDCQPKEKQHIVIPYFHLYSKEVGVGSGLKRITTFVYEIRTSPEHSTMLKILFVIFPKEISMISTSFYMD